MIDGQRMQKDDFCQSCGRRFIARAERVYIRAIASIKICCIGRRADNTRKCTMPHTCADMATTNTGHLPLGCVSGRDYSSSRWLAVYGNVCRLLSN
ncbi:hypothetical protein Zmor_025337 [Zophobas morio]|uniref:Uncharacterized protein n=1 Tax=Zophobas morio TaxID=2755281 RepID=A0AA38HTF1_9CUCU|nr:hypothetical protein Zmor_025337 [Zophobas morio]